MGFGKYSMEAENITTTLLGGAMLWFGWFAFNAGSALAADGLAVNALVVTNVSAASGAITWMLASWVKGKPSSLGLISGAVAGLVAITPASGFVGPMAAIIIGGFAGLLCYGALLFRVRKGLDESLDAWAVHGMGGFWGAIATGIFASAAVGGVDGLIYGNTHQFLIQLLDASVAMIYAFVMTYILAVIIDKTMGLRVTEEEEYVGLDISQHGESTTA
jgi:Amt family ammonium transporter